MADPHPEKPDSALVATILEEIEPADRPDVERMLPALYAELRRIAGQMFVAQPADHTLQPTAIVHEAYLKLADRVDVRWRDRRHFMALAAKVMRELLADYARRRNAQKRGGEAVRITLDEAVVADAPTDFDLIAFHDAIARLAKMNARHASIVELRTLAGLSVQETADTLGVSRRTVELDWRTARAWLQCELGEHTEP